MEAPLHEPMKIAQIVSIACGLIIGLSGSIASAQDTGHAKESSSRPSKKSSRLTKNEPSDNVPDEIKSPFRYVIVIDDLQFDEAEGVNEEIPLFRNLTVLMDAQAFNKSNLIYLFKYLADHYSEPTRLSIFVHTSLMTLETLEERAAMSTHTSRSRFQLDHKMARYHRSAAILDSIYEGCKSGFFYDTGKPGHFVTKFVNLPCTVKK